IADIYPWILLPIMNFDITFGELKKVNSDMADNLKKSMKNIEITDDTNLYVEVLEHYFKMVTLREYIEQNGKDMTTDQWRALFFYLLYPLYCITEKIPTFRHNFLDFDTYYIYQKKPSEQHMEFKIKDIVFKVPDIGIHVKLTNFENS